MMKIGDIVIRKSHNNDTLFIVTDYKDDLYYLKGKNVRLYADAYIEDLEKSNKEDKEEMEFVERLIDIKKLDRNSFFYLPGKILHIDGDNDYLLKCLEFYKENKLQAIGKLEKEENIEKKLKNGLNNINLI